jgi:hypothetical protein
LQYLAIGLLLAHRTVILLITSWRTLRSTGDVSLHCHERREGLGAPSRDDNYMCALPFYRNTERNKHVSCHVNSGNVDGVLLLEGLLLWFQEGIKLLTTLG